MGLHFRPPPTINRLRAGLNVGISVFVFLGAVAALALGTGLVPSGRIFGIPIFVAVIMVSLLAAYLRGRQKALSLVVCSELDKECKYFCRQCSAPNLREASDIVQPILGRYNIDSNILEQWRLRNPQGFMEIVNEENVLVGCFVVVGLEASLMEQFKAGKIAESAIMGQDVLPMSATKRLEDVYISGVMVRDPGNFLGSKRTRVLIWCMLKYLRHHFKVSSTKRLYAVALNRDSETLLKALKFRIATSGNYRADKHDLYVIDYTKDRWEEISSRIGDFSAMCLITY